MSLAQRNPVLNTHSNVLVENASNGVVIVDSSNPFLATDYDDCVGAVARLFSVGTESPVVSAITTVGVTGADLTGTYLNGQSLPFEITALSLTSGFAIIILKNEYTF